MKPNLKTYKELAREYNVIPVCKDVMADLETPVSVLKRFLNKKNVFLLESIEGGEKWGRYSFIGIEPELLLEIKHPAQDKDLMPSILRKIYKNNKVASIPGLPRFIGGAVGFLAYEAICDFEKLPPPKSSEKIAPVSKFLEAKHLIVFDNVKHSITIVCATFPGNNPEVAYEKAMQDIAGIENTLLAQPPHEPFIKPQSAPLFKSNISKEDFLQAVRKAKEYIIDGDIIQVVLSQRFSTTCKVPPFQLYRALRFLNPSPYLYFLKIGDEAIVGSSPEIMVRLTGSKIELRPIAGTRRRGLTEQADRELADELLSDEKEKAEHVMLVDLGRNDVGRVAETGSVQVRDYMTIERYSHVMHIVSHIEGILQKDKDAIDLLKATFPAGTLTGAPKIRAMEIINELEKQPRGIYGGAIGYIGYDGSMDMAITIRTLEIRDGEIAVQAGAGIVYNSIPENEYDETCHKARGMQSAVELAAKNFELD